MVFLPGSPSEFDRLFRQNYRKPGIKYFRLTENGHGVNVQLDKQVTGKNIVIRQGPDLTIVALGPALERAVSVSDSLYRVGISAEIVYVNSFKPFDSDSIIQSVNKTRKLVTISDISDVGGLQSKCLESISGRFTFESLDFSVGSFIRGYGEYEDLLKRANLDNNHIYTKVLELFSVA